MREILTGLAIILIVALTAALVAPYFIDWNGQRAFIEARLSEVLGQKVTIGGSIDVKLLPTPYLVLGQTVIGSDEGPVRLSIHHLDLELSVTPLLHGEFDVTQARLVEPTIRVTLAADRTLPALPDAPAFRADVTLDHIAVTGGTLALADPASGRTFSLDNLDFEADAASLAGPFKGAGTEGPEGATTAFRFSTAQARDGRARMRLVIAENAAHAGLDLDGTLALTSAGRESVRQSFDGKVIVSGRLDESAGAPVAWTLSGPLKADPRQATLDGGELRLGDADKGLTLAASGTADLGAKPHIDLDLAAKTLDLDRLSGAPQDEATQGGAKTPPPPQLPPLATLRRALVAATPPLPATIDVKVDTATWAGETLADLSAHLDIGGDGPRPISLAGDGPGGAHLKVDGKLGPERFDGRAALRATDLSRTVKWLAAIDADFPLKRSDVPAGAFSAKADIAVADGGVSGTWLELETGGTRLHGRVRLDPAQGERVAKLSAQLTTSALNLPSLPDIAAWRGSTRALDLDLQLEAIAVRVAEAGTSGLSSGHLKLAMTRTGRHLALTSFRADDLGGATIDAHGTLDPGAAHLVAMVDARRLEAAAALLGQLAPGDVADAFAARSAVLAPAKLKLDAIWGTTAKGAMAPAKASLDGILGATDVHAAIGPEPDGETGAVALRASLAAPEGTALLQQLGVPALPIDALGAGKITLAAHGKPDRPLDTRLDGAVGATTFEVVGPFRVLVSPPGGSGTLKVASPDVSPLLRGLALAFPDMAATLPAEAKGTLAYGTAGLALTDLEARFGGTKATGTLRFAPGQGEAVTGALDIDRLALASVLGLALGPEQPAAPGSAWSNLRFGTGLAAPPPSKIDIKAGKLDIAPGLAASDASFALDVAPGVVMIDRFKAALLDGKVGGTASLRRDGQQAGLEGKLVMDGVGVELPAVRGELTGKLDFAGGGTSAQGLISSLAGSGAATLANLAVLRADPTALPKLFGEVESDELAVDAETVARTYTDLADAPFVAGTRHFDLALAGGTLSFAPRPVERAATGTTTSTIEASLDLRQPSLAVRVTETLDALPKDWSGPPPALVVAWSGPPRAPRQSLDVNAFINAVAARALARESARIEAYELDARERTLFNTRLQSERRRAADKAKAEADAEAARIARAKREAAARAAAKAAQERAAQEKADREKAEQERAAQEPPPPSTRPPDQGAPGEPPAAGR